MASPTESRIARMTAGSVIQAIRVMRDVHRGHARTSTENTRASSSAQPPVILLDEATSAVDSASDADLATALARIVRGEARAVLSIAHRLSTARRADRVLVMEAGQIIEEGPPTELLARGGRFAALVELEEAGRDWRRRPELEEPREASGPE